MMWTDDAQRTDKKLKLVVIVAGIVIIILAVVAGYFYWQSSHKDDSAAKSKSVISEVSDLYIVPTNETPTVAAIQDKSKLSSQAFFKDAQNGDYVLIYSKSKMAILYREKVNKLVNVGPINMNASSSSGTGSGQ